jgi:hypothetical protein
MHRFVEKSMGNHVFFCTFFTAKQGGFLYKKSLQPLPRNKYHPNKKWFQLIISSKTLNGMLFSGKFIGHPSDFMEKPWKIMEKPCPNLPGGPRWALVAPAPQAPRAAHCYGPSDLADRRSAAPGRGLGEG